MMPAPMTAIFMRNAPEIGGHIKMPTLGIQCALACPCGGFQVSFVGWDCYT